LVSATGLALIIACSVIAEGYAWAAALLGAFDIIGTGSVDIVLVQVKPD
jgi:hypothetical protein